MQCLETVCGPVSCEKLGLIAPHEHFFIDTTFEAQMPKNPAAWERFEQKIGMQNLDVLRRNPFLVRDNMVLDDLATAVYELERFRATGGTTIVDLTNVGIHRNLIKLRKLSELSGTNIIAGCGLYTGLTIPEPYLSMSADEIAEWMIREINIGEDVSGVKAGVIGEIGTSETLPDIEKRSLRAAAFANRETGLPIYIHTYPWSQVSLEAINLLTTEGVHPEQICICHLDVAFDYDYLRRVFDKGVYAMFDNFGKEYYFTKTNAVFSGGPFETDIDRVRMIRRLVREGHADRLLIATDVCLKTLLHSYGGWSYDHIFTNIVPMMENEGIDRDMINEIIISNPKRFICSRN